MTPAWFSSAPCKGLTVLFFPDEHKPYPPEVRALCAACPVREPCLEWALTTHENDGIWGGLTARERRLLPQGDRRYHVAPHGTAARYKNAACRCPACTEAHAVRERSYRDPCRSQVSGVA